MIFHPDLLEKILSGEKTQTRRLVYWGKPCRYQPGRTYAVQDGRGRPGIARIYVLSVTKVPVGSITKADARAEGFRSPVAFYERWRQMYGHASGNCWRIEFEVSS